MALASVGASESSLRRSRDYRKRNSWRESLAQWLLGSALFRNLREAAKRSGTFAKRQRRRIWGTRPLLAQISV